MHKLKKIGKWLLYIVVFLVVVLLFGFGYVVYVSKTDPPSIADSSSLSWERNDHGNGFYTIGNNWFRKSNSGLYEMYTEGKPFERGVVNGKLSKELVTSQEDYFNAEIRKMIPSEAYLHFLKYVIGWFNRNLDKNITEEFKKEIYGISTSASDKYNYIGTNYQRILNYHAAHDIGHALQNMALVGCTSFGTWNGASQDSNLIIGRNFDFYVGDDFAKNKIISFNHPSSGYRFMSVTWGGFTGVVSGMNEKGLTVTINAAKSEMPKGAATPVSMVAREIVQYAGNIDEAIAIARKRKMFVSESFLVGSAADNKAVLIEKTPDSLAIYDPNTNEILCTNHFQSKALKNTVSNREQMAENATTYRYKRLNQLIAQNGKNTVQKTINILRDFRGIDNMDIGIGNEKAVNQFIAHHSIVFEPQKLLVWVSTSPWQMGEFVCYDLKKVFAMNGMKQNHEIYEAAKFIAADSFIYTQKFIEFEKYRRSKQIVKDGGEIIADSIIAENPSLYNSYIIAGDYSFKNKEYKKALQYYKKALNLEIASAGERRHVIEMIKETEKKIN